MAAYAIIFLWSAFAGASALDSGGYSGNKTLGISMLVVVAVGGIAFVGWSALVAIALGFIAGPAIGAAVGSSK